MGEQVPGPGLRCSIVPPYILERLALLDTHGSAPARLAATVRAAQKTLAHDAAYRAGPFPWAIPQTSRSHIVPELSWRPHRTIRDAQGTQNLPGVSVREEGGPPTSDQAVNEAYDGLGATYRLFAEIYGRDSIDGDGLSLDGTVHYGVEYDNAFWDGARMVFGDGDGEVFQRFTRSISVIGHELTHGVTQFSAGLVYQGQSGALNESVSDVFGALVEQYLAGQTVDQATWLIGAELLTPQVQGVALRSMKEPGSAYDDDVLGQDPQPGHMTDYVDTELDNGGVHINSGIPNRAFYLLASNLGGHAWDQAGAIWYRTLAGDLAADASFHDFATATLLVAGREFGEHTAAAVRDSWNEVGVTFTKARRTGTPLGPWIDPDVMAANDAR